jgi:hypothetical protein
MIRSMKNKLKIGLKNFIKITRALSMLKPRGAVLVIGKYSSHWLKDWLLQLDYADVLLENEDYRQARQHVNQGRRLCDQFGYQALFKIANHTYEKLK